MPKTLIPRDSYSGRPAGSVPVNFSLDREAVELLLKIAPSRRARGEFISRLLFEHAVRLEERAKLRQQLATVLTEPNGGPDGE